MGFIELSALAEKLLTYAPPNNLTGVVAGGIIGNRADALRGLLGQKLWQNTKKWYQQEVADLDIPTKNTLPRAIRRSYLTSLVQTCDQSILFIQCYENGDEYLTSQRTKLQALYQKLKRTLPTLCSFPLSDVDYQIRLIEIIRKSLVTEIEQVEEQKNLPDNPTDAVFDQLVLWDYTHALSERQLHLQDEVHEFVLHELKITRGLDVPDALEMLLRLGWLYQGEKQTFFELMCRNFEETITKVEGVSEIFNAKLLAMLGEKMEVVLQEVRATQAGIQRVETQLTTLSDDVADRVVAKMASIDFNLYEKHRYLTTQLITLNESFAELTQKKQKHELKVETVEDDELRELLSGTLQDLQTKLLNTDQQRAALRKELSVFEDDIRTLALSLCSEYTIDSPRLQMAKTLFEKGDLEGASRVLNPEELERDKISIEKAEAFLIQQRQSLTQEYLTKAKLIVLGKSTPTWFVEAKYFYTEAVKIQEDYDICFAVAYFLAAHNVHEEAIYYYEKVLKLVTNDSQRALILNNLANINSDIKKNRVASQQYSEALQIYRSLAIDDPGTYLPGVAMTLNNIACLHQVSQQIALAEEKFQEAYQIYKSLAESNLDSYLTGVASALFNLAYLHQTKNPILAESEYFEALEIRKYLALANPEIFLPAVATTLNGLANLHCETQELKQAEEEFREALNIFQSLAAHNPEAHLPGVAMTLNNLSNLYRITRQWVRFDQEIQNALNIRQALAKQNPSAFQLDFAVTLINVGIFYRNDSPNKEKSLTYSLRAYKNALPFISEVAEGQRICHISINIWKHWGEDLQEYLQEN